MGGFENALKESMAKATWK